MTYDITVYNTRDGVDRIIKHVPADSVRDACHNVAKLCGWIVVENPDGQVFAISPSDFKFSHDLRTQADGKHEEAMARLIEEVKDGETDEDHGLYLLYQDDTPVFDYSKLSTTETTETPNGT